MILPTTFSSSLFQELQKISLGVRQDVLKPYTVRQVLPREIKILKFHTEI